jgi:hypothetical protein
MSFTQQMRWGLNHRDVAAHVVAAVISHATGCKPETFAPGGRLEAIHEVMDALDYVWKQGETAGLLKAKTVGDAENLRQPTQST